MNGRASRFMSCQHGCRHGVGNHVDSAESEGQGFPPSLGVSKGQWVRASPIDDVSTNVWTREGGRECRASLRVWVWT